MEKLGIECKQLMTKEIKEKIEQSPHLFIASFNRMVVPEQEQLRRKLKEIDASFLVLKNRILKRIFQQLNLENLSALMQGLIALALGGRNYVSVSKTLVDFAGKHQNFKILGAYLDEQFLDLNSVKRLASISSKETLFVQIVYGVKSPIQGLVNTLSATIKKFVVVIDKIKENK